MKSNETKWKKENEIHIICDAKIQKEIHKTYFRKDWKESQ